MRRLFATNFGIWPHFSHLKVSVSDQIYRSQAHRSALANYLLLYDQIVIPTGNFQILPVLRLLLGDDVFAHLVRNRFLVLVRFDRWLSYGGNGLGIGLFSIQEQAKQNPSVGGGYFYDMEKAIDIALSNTAHPIRSMPPSQMKRLLLESSVELPLSEMNRRVPKETYADIAASRYLRAHFGGVNLGRPLNELAGIGANQLRLFSPHDEAPGACPDALGVVLHVAFENLLLEMCDFAEASDITARTDTVDVVAAKLRRTGAAATEEVAFRAAQDIYGVPDLGAAFAAGELDSAAILTLRESKRGAEFREWCGRVDASASADERIDRYRQALLGEGPMGTDTARVLRYLAVSTLGAIDLVSGLVAGAVDSFLIDAWARRSAPRLFLDQAKYVGGRERGIPPPTAHGALRNSPCICGSGRKAKRCCGSPSARR